MKTPHPASRRKQAAHLVEYAALRSLAALLRAVPVWAGAAAMGRLFEVLGPLTKRHARVGRNLSIAFPERSREERKAIAAGQWNNLGRTFAEALQVDRIGKEPDLIRFDLPDELARKLRRSGTGVVFVAPHTANWEMLKYPLRRYRPIAVVYRPLANPLADRYVAALRAGALEGGLLPKGPQTPARVMRWVRAGNAIGVLGDLRESRGIEVTFFGRPTTGTPFPAMVARRLGVPLIACRTVRLPRSRFRIEAVEIPIRETGDIAGDVKAATQALLDRFEAWIRDRPGEWMWVQDRWRSPRASPQAGKSTEPADLSEPDPVP